MPDDRNAGITRAARRHAQASAFDRIGERYDEAFPHKEGQLSAVSWLVDQLERGARVLDAGCGTGVPTARQLAEAGLKVLGIDISPVMVRLARENVPAATFAEMDIMDVTPEFGEFAAVTAFFSLLMLPRADIPRALARLREIIAPGGWLVLGMVEADVDDVPISFLGSEIRVTGYPSAGLRDVVTRAGFAVRQENSLTYAPASAGVPPEVQLTLCCQRAAG